MTTPVLVFIQLIFYSVPLHNKLKLALVPICIGVMMATSADLEINFLGTIVAICGILSTSVYQIFVKTKQQDLDLNSFQLLFNQAPLAAVVVFAVSLLQEESFSENGWVNYPYDTENVIAIAGSCILAFCVNLSIFLVIGKSSPMSYNVLGHFKLCVVLISGYLFFHEEFPSIKLWGTFLTFLGVVVYTHLKITITENWDSRKKDIDAKKEMNDNDDNVPLLTINKK